MRKRKLFHYSIGHRANRVQVKQRQPGGCISVGVYDPSLRGGIGDYRWASLHHRDEARARVYAAEQHDRLMRGLDDLRAGPVTFARLCALYLEHCTPRKRSAEADLRNAELFTRLLGGDKDPHKITLREWEGFLDARRTGAIDSRGRTVTAKDRRAVRARTVEVDATWLHALLNWGARWRDDQGHYLLRENCVRGYPIPREQNPRRPVASQDRYEALRAVSDEVLTEIRAGGRLRRSRSCLTELLEVANGTGRRLSAVRLLRYQDLRLSEGPFGAIRWPAETDKGGRETVVPITPDVRAAVDRVQRERPGIGAAYLFPAPGDASKPVSRHLADRWLRRAHRLAGLEPQEGSLWHAYRRKWATSRKNWPDVDVAAAGGWKGLVSLKRAYQQSDPETMLRVVLEAAELREIRR